MNAWVGERLSIITPKAQTTRHRILGILNGENFQMVLSDTPGVIQPNYAMQSSMMDFVKTALEDADILVYMLEIGESKMKDEQLFTKIKGLKIPMVVLINKIDASNPAALDAAVAHWQTLLPQATIFPISALTGFGVEDTLSHLKSLLPPSPPYFPKDQFTDKPERFFVNEAIREQILEQYEKEIPYAVEVTTDAFVEEAALIRIRSVIMVERESQKGILIGHKGSALKRVGVGARKKLEVFFAKKIYLELFVKVNKDWRSNERQLKRFGYKY